MSRSTPVSRRAFLHQASAFSALAGVGGPMALNLAAMGNAAAQSATGYKALVCIFLYGGNDAFNMVLPTDAPSWDAYVATRNRALSSNLEPSTIALASPGTPAVATALPGSPAHLGGVLPIAPITAQGRTFALHPAMPQAQALFNGAKRLAVVANVGPLRLPTTKAQYKNPSHLKPLSLFSHNDQQNTWQAFAPEGATLGWGGRLGDTLMSQNGTEARFTAISAAGNAVWLNGASVRQYQVSPRGAIRMGGFDWEGGLAFGSASVQAALEKVATASRTTHLLEQDVAGVMKRSVQAEAALRSALPAATAAPWATTETRFTDPLTGSPSEPNPLALQLQVVARMVAAATSATNPVTGATPALPLKRQVFFVSAGGYDTHDRQNGSHARLMAQLSHALQYFDTLLGAIGARDSVTTFTASDFGRSFTTNGDGTDHGWGAHHLVMGGAVRGGELYGNFPVLGVKNAGDNEFDSSPNQIQNGVLLPEISVDQYGATMGKWFGLSDTQLLDIFPNLSAFDASKRNLAFMSA
jgi:uncharacterized protein (DUF1501 family)